VKKTQSLLILSSSRERKKARWFFGAALVVGLMLVSNACQKAGSATQPAVQVFVTDVIQKDVPIYSNWVGTTVGFVNAQIRPQVQGFLVKQTYKDGDFVKAGQLLFQIDHREYKAAFEQALGNLAQQEAVLKKNQLDVARLTPLETRGAASKEELDDAVQSTLGSEAQVQTAKAAVETARLNLEWTKVESPIDGIAEIATVQVGDLVNPSALLTTVSQVDPIKVTFPISEQEYLQFADRIKEHAETGRAKDEPDLEMILANGITYKYPGRFYVTNRQVDLQTGTIQVQGVFPNPENILRPGLYAKVRAATEVRRGALLVPQRAVQETQGQYQVAIVGPDDKVTLRTVKPGDQVDNLWIIDDGLQLGEHVVSEGLQKVKDGMVVKPQAAPESSPGPSPAAKGEAAPRPATASPGT
jgi:RND family efflux transporter MFP subunit